MIGVGALDLRFLVDTLARRLPGTMGVLTEVSVAMTHPTFLISLMLMDGIRGEICGLRGPVVETLTVTSCFALEASKALSQTRKRGMQLGRGGSLFAVVDLRVTDAGRPSMSLPPFNLSTIFNGFGTEVFSREDWFADGSVGIDVSLGEGRRDGGPVDREANRDVSFVREPRGTDNRSPDDISGGIGDSPRTGVFTAGAYRFVEMLLTTNGLEDTVT